MRCPHCNHQIPAKLIMSEAGRLSFKKRKTNAGGRPRLDAPRCPCGANTFARARARSFDCCRQAGIAVSKKPIPAKGE